ncbi:MAG: hypothetical protein OWQ54_04565 [Sulfolobaceae archaeon]|nr:hypothetical protein [Sulfolobaceae archaeon]
MEVIDVIMNVIVYGSSYLVDRLGFKIRAENADDPLTINFFEKTKADILTEGVSMGRTSHYLKENENAYWIYTVRDNKEELYYINFKAKTAILYILE